MRCIKGYVIEILRSPAGYYVGTRDKGCPNCRISNYRETPGQLDEYDYSKMLAIENLCCNCGRHCLTNTKIPLI